VALHDGQEEARFETKGGREGGRTYLKGGTLVLSIHFDKHGAEKTLYAPGLSQALEGI